jgi:hypothetical protein
VSERTAHDAVCPEVYEPCGTCGSTLSRRDLEAHETYFHGPNGFGTWQLRTPVKLEFQVEQDDCWSGLAYVASKFGEHASGSRLYALQVQEFSVVASELHFRMWVTPEGPRVQLSPNASFHSCFGGVFQLSSSQLRLERLEAKIDRVVFPESDLPESMKLRLASCTSADSTHTVSLHWNESPLRFWSAGVDEKELSIIMSQTRVTRNRATWALIKNRGDVVNAIMELVVSPWEQAN